MSVWNEAFEQLLDDYRRTLRTRAEEIGELVILLDRCSGHEPHDKSDPNTAGVGAVMPLRCELVARLGEIAHGLAGSGASFGFSEVSRAADELRRHLRRVDSDAIGSAVVVRAAHRLTEICRELGEPSSLGASAAVLSPNSD